MDEEVITEIEYYRDSLKAMYERADRLVKRLRSAPPEHVEYDRERFDAPPRAVQPQTEEAVLCHCGLKAEFKKSAPQNPKKWSAYFCARPKSDPKNCGYRKWID